MCVCVCLTDRLISHRDQQCNLRDGGRSVGGGGYCLSSSQRSAFWGQIDGTTLEKSKQRGAVVVVAVIAGGS